MTTGLVRWRAVLARSRDIVLGILAGAVLALVTVVGVITAERHALQISANGWSTTLQCGQFRHGLLLRAACASDVGALNVPEEEVYWQAFVDSAGHRLNGQRDYRLRFAPGGLPPNAASWSVTLGDTRRRMVDNPIHRYSLGARSGLVPDADGSIDIDIQHTMPAGHASNWLPAPAGGFMLWLRVYQPGPAILAGHYRVPPVVEVK